MIRIKFLHVILRPKGIEKGVTQAELAEAIDVSESSISLIERGIQSPSIFLVYDISRFLEIDIK